MMKLVEPVVRTPYGPGKLMGCGLIATPVGPQDMFFYTPAVTVLRTTPPAPREDSYGFYARLLYPRLFIPTPSKRILYKVTI
jgi:hypothetical protein